MYITSLITVHYHLFLCCSRGHMYVTYIAMHSITAYILQIRNFSLFQISACSSFATSKSGSNQPHIFNDLYKFSCIKFSPAYVNGEKFSMRTFPNLQYVGTCMYMCMYVRIYNEMYTCLFTYIYVITLQYYRSPLHCACQDGNPDAAEILLQAGANVQLADRVSIYTCLHIHCST